jgi:hypothetical protein
MKRLYFWKEWIQPYKGIYWLFFILFSLTLLFAIYNYFVGLEYVIHWELLDKLDQLKVVAHTVTVGNFKFDIPVDNYVVFQYFNGSNLELNAYNGYIYLCLLIISVNLIMALLPSMPKVWFYAGMGGFIGFVVLLNIDQILLFGQADKTALIIVLTLYLSAGYYFKEINADISILRRFVVFCTLSFLTAILFFKYAEVNDPFLFIANYGILAPIIITTLFIVFVAHEIIFGFLHLITNSNTIGSKNSLQHFLVISLFYLSYVGLTYLYYTRQIDWDLVYLNPFLIAGITFVLGIWGYKRREDLFKEIFGFYPVGALFYLGFGVISVATFSYIFANANDPLMESLEDVILYSQIGFGVMFFIYVVTNFGPMLLQNMKVSKVVYRSRVLPFSIFRIGGLLVFGYIFYSANFLPYYQSMAGYYNFIGDIYLIENRLDLSEEYYNEASEYEFQNHRSNYAMATLARLKNDRYDEAFYFSNALLKQPSEFSYVNLSNVYLHNDQYFDGMFKLQEALKEYPNSYPILNNMGYYYSRTDIVDSAYYFFDLSEKNKWRGKVPASNIYGLLAKSNIDISIDSLAAQHEIDGNVAGTANKLAMQNQFGIYTDETPSLEINKDYSRSYFAYIYNTGLNALKAGYSSYYNDLLDFSDSSRIDFYKNKMTILASLNKYFNHRVTESFRLLYELGEQSLMNDEYFNMLGILALDLGSPRLAIDYFKRTSTQINEKYRLHLALAYIETGLTDSSEVLLNTLLSSSDANIRAVSEAYLPVINWDEKGNVDVLDDEDKYLLIRYRYKGKDPRMKDIILRSINNVDIRLLIQIEEIEFLLASGKIQQAFENFQNTDLIDIHPEMKTRVEKLKYTFAINGLDIGLNLTGYNDLSTGHPLYLYQNLYNMKMEAANMDTIQMDSIYNFLATWDPFYEDGIIAAVDYFNEERNKDNYAYNLLVNALTVNAYSIPLNKYYIQYCLDDGLIDFARNRVSFIRAFMDPDDFKEYFKAISAEISRKEAEMDAWGS